jgi:hypothetical protein
VPSDGYHIASVLQDRIPGGTCEKELVDYCGVPVEYNAYPTAGDRTFYTATEGYDALYNAFSVLYGVCMDTLASSWPPFGIGCGGTGTQVACERAAWEVINEVAFPAYPLVYFSLDGNGYGVQPQGWSDFNVLGPPPNPAGPFPPPNYNVWSGTVLGDAKTNGQEYMETPTQAAYVPGACDSGGCNNFPINYSGWTPANFTANLPQNIVNAGERLGKEIVPVAVGSGIAAGYNTCTPSYCCIPE